MIINGEYFEMRAPIICEIELEGNPYISVSKDPGIVHGIMERIDRDMKTRMIVARAPELNSIHKETMP